MTSTTPAFRDGDLPERFADVHALDEFLTRPSRVLSDELAALDGDIIILGVGGKMGPTLARLAKRAAPDKRVIAVARFSKAETRAELEQYGVETIACDLLDAASVNALPKVRNVIFMAGRKFGSDDNQPATWASNAIMPGIVAEAFRESRIVAFSTGCVYAFADVTGKGSIETDPLSPPGEYANSCVGRERVFEYYSEKYGTPGVLFRLNYAIDLRYGVLHDIATRVLNGQVIDVSMSHVNVIWQGDANTLALRCLTQAAVPTLPLNVTGPEVVSVRWLAEAFGRKLQREPVFTGTETETCWLSDSSKANGLFGLPSVSLERMIDWTADWVAHGGVSHNKPTGFEKRDGAF